MGLDRIEAVFARHRAGDTTRPLLNVYFTAGYPSLDDTQTLLLALDGADVDLIELGLPYSDPLADGPTIQESSSRALRNGVTLARIFEDVAAVRDRTSTPIIAMGYYNQVLQYGAEAFLAKCVEVGIDGLILPDLPLEVYREELERSFERHGLGMSFLVTPRTLEARVRALDAATRGFLYVVSSSSTTGSKGGDRPPEEAYFARLAAYGLSSPRLIGFNISDASSLAATARSASGGIIGSAFIRALDADDVAGSAKRFVESVRA